MDLNNISVMAKTGNKDKEDSVPEVEETPVVEEDTVVEEGTGENTAEEGTDENTAEEGTGENTAEEGTGEDTAEKGGLELPGLSGEASDEAGKTGDTGEAGTAVPATSPDTKSEAKPSLFANPWTYVILALVAVLAAFLFFKKFKKSKSNEITQIGESNPILDATAPNPVPTPVAAAKPGIRAGAMQHIGKREDQQDSYGVSSLTDFTHGFMAVVADGMGGLANGKLVSSTVVRSFLETHRDLSEGKAPQELLLEAAVRTNAQVNQVLHGGPRSGSTLVAALIHGNRLHFLTVGDSHIYLYRGGGLIQLNREHVYQEELAVKAVNRAVPIAQVTGDRQAHALTSYFGIGTMPHIDRSDIGIKLVPGDKILLASDGVFGTLTQAQLEQALELPPEQGAQKLQNLVLEADRAYQDNNTAIILEYR